MEGTVENQNKNIDAGSSDSWQAGANGTKNNGFSHLFFVSLFLILFSSVSSVSSVVPVFT